MKLTSEQRTLLDAIIHAEDGGAHTYTVPDERRHYVARELQEMRAIRLHQRRGFAFYWSVTDAGRAALKDGAK